MKLLIITILAALTISAFAEEIDWSKVVPVTELPGFWEGREITPILFPNGVNRSRTARIVGGEIVTPHTHPYQAGLLVTFSWATGLCGGSLISTTRVVTAAHCPIGGTSTQVIFGAHELNTVEDTQQRRIVPSDNYRIHPSYNPSNFNNDVAVLILPTAVEFTAQIQPITLASGSATYEGITAKMSGWGRISDGSSTQSTQLRNAEQPVISNAACAAVFGTDTVISSTICTSTAGGRGTCSGDSGGPLTIADGSSRLLIGISSFVSASGCENGFPAGFTRVTSFNDWISAQ